MCGRYTQTRSADEIRALIEFDGDDRVLGPRYNIAPSQPAPVITADHQLHAMPWGLVPAWAHKNLDPQRLINVRAETVGHKPAFRQLLERQRCVVPADGFYEWQKTGRCKQPFLFQLRSRAPFAFAGLWDRWRTPDGVEERGFAILTTDANALVRPIHHRMPVLLGGDACARWLNPPVAVEDLAPLMQSYPADAMSAYAVNPVVNSPDVDSPECIAPASTGPVSLEFDFGG